MRPPGQTGFIPMPASVANLLKIGAFFSRTGGKSACVGLGSSGCQHQWHQWPFDSCVTVGNLVLPLDITWCYRWVLLGVTAGYYWCYRWVLLGVTVRDLVLPLLDVNHRWVTWCLDTLTLNYKDIDLAVGESVGREIPEPSARRLSR